MTKQASPKIRLFVPQPFVAGATLLLPENQSHYLAQVMRIKEGDSIAVFNGSDGLWQASVSEVRKRSVVLSLNEMLEAQRQSPDVWLAFAPIKQHTERLVEKAVELGASRLLPTIMQHSVVRSVNEEKLAVHAIEASEQCERHDVANITAYKDLPTLLGEWPADRVLLHADETGGGKSLSALLPELKAQKLGLLIGPEGGFSADERRVIAAHPAARSFGMGPRILRADTAAFAALACVQCYAGDWNEPPRFKGVEE